MAFVKVSKSTVLSRISCFIAAFSASRASWASTVALATCRSEYKLSLYNLTNRLNTV